ncbi:collagen alpha-1(I) chain-like [Pituophis catenifer annectens]|uniref:collagen alpha-1(I) chain-like n=1 Tax=Pituophis catenifer annectens TaxID=94852 RepID=UPI003995D725
MNCRKTETRASWGPAFIFCGLAKGGPGAPGGGAAAGKKRRGGLPPPRPARASTRASRAAAAEAPEPRMPVREEASKAGSRAPPRAPRHLPAGRSVVWGSGRGGGRGASLLRRRRPASPPGRGPTQAPAILRPGAGSGGRPSMALGAIGPAGRARSWPGLRGEREAERGSSAPTPEPPPSAAAAPGEAPALRRRRPCRCSGDAAAGRGQGGGRGGSGDGGSSEPAGAAAHLAWGCSPRRFLRLTQRLGAPPPAGSAGAARAEGRGGEGRETPARRGRLEEAGPRVPLAEPSARPDPEPCAAGGGAPPPSLQRRGTAIPAPPPGPRPARLGWTPGRRAAARGGEGGSGGRSWRPPPSPLLPSGERRPGHAEPPCLPCLGAERTAEGSPEGPPAQRCPGSPRGRSAAAPLLRCRRRPRRCCPTRRGGTAAWLRLLGRAERGPALHADSGRPGQPCLARSACGSPEPAENAASRPACPDGRREARPAEEALRPPATRGGGPDSHLPAEGGPAAPGRAAPPARRKRTGAALGHQGAATPHRSLHVMPGSLPGAPPPSPPLQALRLSWGAREVGLGGSWPRQRRRGAWEEGRPSASAQAATLGPAPWQGEGDSRGPRRGSGGAGGKKPAARGPRSFSPPGSLARSLARTAPLPSPGSVRDGGQGAAGAPSQRCRGGWGWPARRDPLARRPPASPSERGLRRRAGGCLAEVPAEGSAAWPGPSWGEGASPSQLVGRGLDFLVLGLVNSRRGEERSGAEQEKEGEPASQPSAAPAAALPAEGRPWRGARRPASGGEPSATIGPARWVVAALRAAGMPSGPAPPCPGTEPSPAAL